MTTNNLATPETWQIAQSHLNDSDMKRLACCYFFGDHTKIDYEAAATAYGSASANSFRVMLSAAVKKVRDIEKNGGAPLASPAKARGGKRKNDGNEADAGAPPKKKGRPAKKPKETRDDDDDKAGNGKVKKEDGIGAAE